MQSVRPARLSTGHATARRDLPEIWFMIAVASLTFALVDGFDACVEAAKRMAAFVGVAA